MAALRAEGVVLSAKDGNLKLWMVDVIERHRFGLIASLQEGNPFED